MSNSLILEQVSKSELKDLIGQAVAEQISKGHQATTPTKELTILTRQQTAQTLGITRSSSGCKKPLPSAKSAKHRNMQKILSTCKTGYLRFTMK